MSYTSVTGFPRIGKLRELKFATESFFKNEITESDLLNTAHELKEGSWKKQSAEGIDFIPSNDFSFYDNVLDTAVLFNVIPSRYRNLPVSELQRYFAMARGYQKDGLDVHALPMKKWFNTNYHYIVPEFEDGTSISLAGNKPVEEYLEAKKLGLQTKPVIIGPFTFLSLLKFTGNSTKESIASDLTAEYVKLIKCLSDNGAEWIQFDEPSLVKDLDDADISLFEKIYQSILENKSGCKVLLNTYFGDTRDIYSKLITMDFDGLGLDLIEGRDSLELIKKNGFSNNALLFAGVVNGKNIWRNDYAKTLDILAQIKAAGVSQERIVISTSCSLLHVPYTLDNETKLEDGIKKHFVFAYEKLGELSELAYIADHTDERAKEILNKNADILTADRNATDPEVQKKLAAITEADFVRLPAFAEREKIQKEKFGLPAIPTTTIGSFPQTKEIKKERSLYTKGQITKDEYESFIKERIREVIRLQEEIGLDVLVHGEFERNDMVEYFGEHLNGYLFTEKAWVQSYGTRCVKPPIIWGDVSRKEAITVKWSKYAAEQTDKPVKGMLTGPVTILNWSFPREDISRKESVYQIALAIRDEVLDLEANGIRIIQIDEAALREKLPLRRSDWYSEYLDWAIPTFRLVSGKVKADTQIHTHMCYSEFTDIIPAIDDMDADVITFEASRSDLQILDSLKENNFKTEVGPGVYDIHSPRVPSVEEIESALKKMLEKIDASKLWANPDCGLKTRGNEETIPSLKNLVAAAKRVRDSL